VHSFKLRQLLQIWVSLSPPFGQSKAAPECGCWRLTLQKKLLPEVGFNQQRRQSFLAALHLFEQGKVSHVWRFVRVEESVEDPIGLQDGVFVGSRLYVAEAYAFGNSPQAHIEVFERSRKSWKLVEEKVSAGESWRAHFVRSKGNPSYVRALATTRVCPRFLDSSHVGPYLQVLEAWRIGSDSIKVLPPKRTENALAALDDLFGAARFQSRDRFRQLCVSSNVAKRAYPVIKMLVGGYHRPSLRGRRNVN
jgi:hypothetical protein